jgi:tetratricopeptide (TPR) repeat protein
MKRIIIILSVSLSFLFGCIVSTLTSAKLNIQNGDLYNAKRLLESEVQSNKQDGNEGYYNNAEVYYLLGYVEGELNNIDKMITCFDDSESISFKFAENIKESKNYHWASNFNKGVEAYNNSDFESAMKYYEYALKLKPGDEDTKRNYSFILAQINNKSETTLPESSENSFIGQKNTNTKDITGFQNFKWEISIDDAKKILLNNNYELENSNDGFVTMVIPNFTFQKKESALRLDFYLDKLYKATVHFYIEGNTSGMNEYFSMANLIKDVYGTTIKIPIGRESDNYNHRVTQISIGNLSYQHRWDALSGNLTFQLSEGNYDNFLCSLFYSSKQAQSIDDHKSKSEF